jgi:hypothetical protein
MDRSDDRLSEMVLTVLGRRLKNQNIFNQVTAGYFFYDLARFGERRYF